MARVLYKNVRTMAMANREMAKLSKAGLRPAVTDGGYVGKSRKGLDVYAVAKSKNLVGFKSRQVRMSYKY